ncbi:Acyltransferase [Aeromicrobium marinum DSM 15272]|uniref:Acyltransferase n=1 Tax=Aeromicrobium marinum DSM 15272 TaxID=585531 RepID=E2S9N1_9ACTN|nr:lysophospholipid acyltransferase family protein [Aeromicrobium marinum]EFQ83955.1 Acyltransferase [Aeromicrobium marinum DSM 15272]
MSRAPHGMPEAVHRLLKPFFAAYMRRRWDVRVVGVEHVPRQGPAIVVSNHIGWLDGPLVTAMLPRIAHTMTKSEAFEGRTRHLLRAAGQIRVRREEVDVGALRRAAAALEAGQVVVVFPEGIRGAGDVATTKAGAAWLALVSGAPIVPVAVFGTRDRGAGVDARPAPGARLDLVLGKPLRLVARPWPRDARTVADADRRIREHLATHVARTADDLGRTLPGPLPVEENADAGV